MAKAFDLSNEELVELKKLGLSDNVIKFLLDPSQPYTPPPPPVVNRTDAPPAAPPVPAKQYPKDANASKVPAEPLACIDCRTTLLLKSSSNYCWALRKKEGSAL